MVRITDIEALDKMAEGWRLEAVRVDREVSFGRARVSYDKFLAQNSDKILSDRDLNSTLNMRGHGGIIYGVGGFNRYYVLLSGEIVFSKSHGARADLIKAEALGFRIWV